MTARTTGGGDIEHLREKSSSDEIFGSSAPHDTEMKTPTKSPSGAKVGRSVERDIEASVYLQELQEIQRRRKEREGARCAVMLAMSVSALALILWFMRREQNVAFTSVLSALAGMLAMATLSAAATWLRSGSQADDLYVAARTRLFFLKLKRLAPDEDHDE